MMMVSNEEKRWIVVGIAMFKVAAPVLRDVVKQGMHTHYTNLDAHCSGLHTPCTLKTMTYLQVNADPSLKHLKFQNVNNNFHLHGKNRNLYNYCINDSIDLAKLYLPDYLAQFSAFDDSLDMAAILRLLGFANYLPSAVFSAGTRASADDVRENVRNEWGHFDVNEWTDAFFNTCFAKLETLVKNLGLTAGVETTTLDQLNDWRTKGCHLCMGHAVDQNLLSLVQQDVKELIKKYRETNTQQAAIQISLDQLKKEHEDFLHQQEQQMKGQEQQMKGLQEQIKEQEQQMKEQEEQMKEQEQQMKEQEEQMKEQEEQMKEQGQQMKEQEEQMKEQGQQMKEQEEQMKEQEQQMKEQEQQIKESKEVLEKLVSVEETLREELLIRVQGVEEGLAQAHERVKQLEEDFKGQRLKGDGPDVLGASSQETTVLHSSHVQGSQPSCSKGTTGSSVMKQSGWSKVKGFFQQDAFLKWSRNQLRSFYNSTMSQVMITPWNPDDTVHIDEVYVKLSFLRDDRKPDGTTKVEIKNYREIFQSHGRHVSPKRIVVYGRPGIGKSTFSKKLAVDWSRSKKILKKFDVLLLVKLQDVCDTQDLRSMLEKAELLSADDPTVFDRLYSFIIENQQKVLLVLDGYDEYSGEKSSPVHQIWRGTQLRDCSVLMTSRPTKEEELVTPSHAQFEISGFSGKGVRRFAFKIFKNREDVSRFTDFLSKRSLWDMAEIPLLLLMLCLTWKEKGLEELAASRANIYDSFLETLFNHMAAKDRGKAFASLDDYKEALAKLGEFAFDALLVDCLYLKLDIFPEDIRALIEKLIEVGFFQISKLSRSVRPVQVLFFLHKSIQEFLSAKVIIRELENAEKAGDFTWLSKIDSLEKIEKLIEVLKFVCELSSEAASIVLSHLRSVGEKEGLTECGFSDTPSIEELSENQKEFRIISLDCMLSCPVSQRQDVYSQFLQCVNSVVVIGRNPQLSVVAREHLLRVSRRVALPDYLFFSRSLDVWSKVSIMGDLETVVITPNGATKVNAGLYSGLRTNDFYLKAEGQQMVLCVTHIVNESVRDERLQPVELLRAFTSTQESLPLKPVDHASQNQDISSGQENTSALVLTHSLSFVRKIEISHPTSEMLMVMNTLFSSVLNKPQVVRISDIPETCSAHLIETLVSRIPFTNNLYKLELADINLTAKSAAVIAKSLLQVPHLKKLKLHYINLHGSVDYLFENLHNLLQLTKLSLRDCHRMGAEECQSVAAALKHLPCLKVLEISWNPLGQGISELAKQFIHVPHLTELNLRRTQMGEEEVTAVAHSLQSISNLKQLDLSFNPLHQGITKLAKHFIHVPHLTELELRYTQMGEEEVTAVAHALKDVPELELLDLSNNPLGRGVGELTKHLSSIPKLRGLGLERVKMTKKEASDLCTAAQEKEFRIWSDYFVFDFRSDVTRLRTKSERALDLIRSKF